MLLNGTLSPLTSRLGDFSRNGVKLHVALPQGPGPGTVQGLLGAIQQRGCSITWQHVMRNTSSASKMCRRTLITRTLLPSCTTIRTDVHPRHLAPPSGVRVPAHSVLSLLQLGRALQYQRTISTQLMAQCEQQTGQQRTTGNVMAD